MDLGEVDVQHFRHCKYVFFQVRLELVLLHFDLFRRFLGSVDMRLHWFVTYVAYRDPLLGAKT